MAQITLQVEMVIDIHNDWMKNSIQKVTDSIGEDRTIAFKNFARDRQLSISTQAEIEAAVLEYVKQNEASLP